MRIGRTACVAGMVGLLGLLEVAAAAAAAQVVGPAGVHGMIELVLRGEKIEGMPLAWSEQEIHLLGRDGRLWSFPPKAAVGFRQTADRFEAYSVSQIRATLLRELGRGYEVTGTAHYMVAHPTNQHDQWAERFEGLYRAFVRYFSVRGFRLAEPPFPLIGIVCRDRAEFERHAAFGDEPAGKGILGYYSLDTNRILLYDVGGGKGTAADWRENADTVIHEATHQIAFNTGVHNRYSQPPLWVAEGLATLFEARGIHDPTKANRREDQINRGRLDNYRAFAVRNTLPDLTKRMVLSDHVFRANPPIAYAEAWAMTYYLIQTQPSQFARYLALTASHPPFEDVTPAQRQRDFTSVFGSNWPMFEAQFTRFMAGVK